MSRCFRLFPWKDYLDNAQTDVSEYFAESPKYFYSLDGKRKLKKSHTRVDSARRRVLQDDDLEEREYWMKEWGLM